MERFKGKFEEKLGKAIPLFSILIEAKIMLEQAYLLRKFRNYRSVKLFSTSPWCTVWWLTAAWIRTTSQVQLGIH